MPKIAVISDIHGNLPALNKVLEVLDEESPDHWICLGDLVGYGPNPAECIQIIMEREIPTVKGNHDSGVTGEVQLNHFRNPNRKLIEISKSLISKDQMKWLKSLPLILESENWIAAHASPINPQNWTYVESAFHARDIIKQSNVHLCFIGHTHKPALVSEKFGVNRYQKEGKFLVNPGSVGQSRDGDYRASCCIIDTKAQIYKNIRVEYNIENNLTGLMKLGFSRNEASHLLRV